MEKYKRAIDSLNVSSNVPALDYIKEVNKISNKEGLSYEAFMYLMQMNDIPQKVVDLDDLEQKRELRRYVDLYENLMKGFVKRLSFKNLDERKFYENIFHFIQDEGIVDKKEIDRCYAWLFVWRCTEIPYFWLDKTKIISMENDEYAQYTEELDDDINKLAFIMNHDFEQRTERSSMVLSVIDKYEDPKQRAVLLSKVLGNSDEAEGKIKSALYELFKT